jgi:hypothetical protein
MNYTEEEAQRRFEAALRGARVAGHKTKESVASKPKAKRATKAKAGRRT